MLSCQPGNLCQSQPEVLLLHCFSQTPLWQPALDKSEHQSSTRVGCTYWVVMDHHAVQQSWQSIEATCIQTWEGDKNAAYSEPATFLLGSEKVEMQSERPLGAAESQESQPDIDYWNKCRSRAARPQHRMHPAVSELFLGARGRAVRISGTERSCKSFIGSQPFLTARSISGIEVFSSSPPHFPSQGKIQEKHRSQHDTFNKDPGFN